MTNKFFKETEKSSQMAEALPIIEQFVEEARHIDGPRILRRSVFDTAVEELRSRIEIPVRRINLAKKSEEFWRQVDDNFADRPIIWRKWVRGREIEALSDPEEIVIWERPSSAKFMAMAPGQWMRNRAEELVVSMPFKLGGIFFGGIGGYGKRLLDIRFADQYPGITRALEDIKPRY